MAVKIQQYKMPPATTQTSVLRLERIDGGLNVRNEQSMINDNQSPYMVNMMADNKGCLTKRKGQVYVYETSLGDGSVNGLWLYRKLNGTIVRIVHWGTELFIQSGYSQPQQIYSGVSNTKSSAFVMYDTFYFLDGTNYLQYDGTIVSEVKGYVPTITLGRAPSGGGIPNEQLNYLSNSWKDSFSGTDSATVYQLSFKGLSSTPVKAWVNGIEKIEDTDFTVDRENGTVTFSTSPGEGTDNVVIQAEKDGLMDSSKIKKCRYVCIFGGKNDTRVFFTGNPDAPSTVYWCDVENPAYFPENNYNAIGSDADFNTAMAVLYDQLILFKERSIYRIEYEISSAGDVTFPSYPINSTVGCDMPYSVQLIDNDIVFCNTYIGPMILTRTDIRSERNVVPIGLNIVGTYTRPGLLSRDKSDLLNATSVDYDGKYILCVGNEAWGWDYRLTPYVNTGNIDADADRLAWFYWTNIKANCWLVQDGELYYGHKDYGLLVLFYKNQNDFGSPIEGVWRSKLFHFGLTEYLKNIPLVYFRTLGQSYSIITVKFLTETGEILSTNTINTSSFSWSHFTWNTFSWAIYSLSPVFRHKPKLKKVTYFQVEFSNNELNQNLSIFDVVIYYRLVRKTKGTV